MQRILIAKTKAVSVGCLSRHLSIPKAMKVSVYILITCMSYGIYLPFPNVDALACRSFLVNALS